VSTQTEIPELGTLPSLTATQTPTMEVEISPTPTVQPTSTISNLPISEISNNNVGCLFGAVLFILLVGGLILFFRTRRKK
jgi:hypothetical protein